VDVLNPFDVGNGCCMVAGEEFGVGVIVGVGGVKGFGVEVT
jgi:hypothetical protein